MDESAVCSREHFQFAIAITDYNQFAVSTERHTRHVDVLPRLQLLNDFALSQIPVRDTLILPQSEQLFSVFVDCHGENARDDCAISASSRWHIHLV